MTRQPDFSGVRVKVERAKEHIDYLGTLVRAFFRSEPYKVVSYNEPDTGDLVYKAKVLAQPPLWWSAVVGDAIHNLRSSLDLLVCEMVRAEGNPVTEYTGFPIFKSADAFKSGYLAKVKGAPKTALDLIKKAKPYKGGDEAFWRLHRLDITDKHNLLVPVGAAYQRAIVDLGPVLDSLPDMSPELAFPAGVPLPIGILPDDRRFPLEDGAELHRVLARDRFRNPMAQPQHKPQFASAVAFDEGEVVEGESLMPALLQLAQFVEGFVESFPPLFSQETAP